MGPLVAVPLAWPVVEAVLREDLASRPLLVSAVLVVNERTRTSHKPMGSRSDPVRDGLAELASGFRRGCSYTVPNRTT